MTTKSVAGVPFLDVLDKYNGKLLAATENGVCRKGRKTEIGRS